ncbi:MAG TPA: carbon-nitrogen hydrolase family protein, partial [Chloroflexia bacterium]|nr:carbon-nitrogen hydrolase family protein [Chloroflexia bacterium]
AQDGRILGVYRKNHVVDEEAEWFSPGTTQPVFTLPLPGGAVPCALAVCADSDRPDLFATFAERGARVVFHSSAPGLYTRRTDPAGWQDGYDWYRGYLAERLPAAALANGLWIATATQTGATADEDFPGGSFVFAPDGTTAAATPDYAETLLIADLVV